MLWVALRGRPCSSDASGGDVCRDRVALGASLFFLMPAAEMFADRDIVY